MIYEQLLSGKWFKIVSLIGETKLSCYSQNITKLSLGILFQLMHQTQTRLAHKISEVTYRIGKWMHICQIEDAQRPWLKPWAQRFNLNRSF